MNNKIMETMETQIATTPVASTKNATSIYQQQNNAINNAKMANIEQKYDQELVNTAGADTLQNLYAGVYNTNLNSLNQSRDAIDKELTNLYVQKYGNADYQNGWTDFTDQNAYAEYLRLMNLKQENQDAINNLNQLENARISENSTQDALRQQQQKYMDTYAKMQGMGYGGYSAGIQSNAYNNYANAVASINNTYNQAGNDIISQYQSVLNDSNNTKLTNAYNNYVATQEAIAPLQPFFAYNDDGTLVTNDDGTINYNPNGYTAQQLMDYYNNNKDTLQTYINNNPTLNDQMTMAVYTALANEILSGDKLSVDKFIENNSDVFSNFAKYYKSTYGKSALINLMKNVYNDKALHYYINYAV